MAGSLSLKLFKAILKLFGGICFGLSSLSFDKALSLPSLIPSTPILLPLTFVFFLSLNLSSIYGFTKLDALLRNELVLFLIGPSEHVRSYACIGLFKSGLLF